MKKILLVVLVLVLIVEPAYAGVSLGASPGELTYRNMLKGGYARRSLTISTSLNQSLPASIILDGEIKDWLSLKPNATEFNMSRTKPYKFNVIVQPPNVGNGNYTGEIHVRTGSIGKTGSAKFGTTITADIKIKVRVEITGQQIPSCQPAGIKIEDTELGENIPVIVNLLNDGNIILSPNVEVYIYDKNMKDTLITESFQDPNIFPTLNQRIVYPIKNNLKTGQYWARIVIDKCNYNKVLTFDIVEPGTLADKGNLLGVNVEPWIYINQTTPIKSIFKNTGKRSEETKIIVEIRKDGNIVKTETTDPIYVTPGETKEFTTYFTPNMAGKYEVRAKALYNKKISYEKGNIINVNPKPKEEKESSWVFIPSLILLILIVAIIRKIIKEKNKLK